MASLSPQSALGNTLFPGTNLDTLRDYIAASIKQAQRVQQPGGEQLGFEPA